MKVNIGKNTLGDNDKMSVLLKEYGRSTHLIIRKNESKYREKYTG
nr:MAG TPA: hypothetical protein [Microviridae sp.]